jgi:hypothetical protein
LTNCRVAVNTLCVYRSIWVGKIIINGVGDETCLNALFCIHCSVCYLVK